MARHRSSYRHPRPRRSHGAKETRGQLVAGMLLVWAAVAGATWLLVPRLSEISTRMTATPEQLAATERSAYYPNCDAARAAGAAPIHQGQPGYRDALDADSDGIACEPYR